MKRIFKRNRTKGNKGVWYYYYYDEYFVRHIRSTGETVRAKAQAYVDEKFKNGTLFDKAYVNTTFEDFAKPFWIPETCPIVQAKVRRGGKITNGYCLSCRQLVDNHLIPAFGKYSLGAPSPDKIEKWLLALPAKAHLNNKTVNKAYMVLKQMLDVAVKQRIIYHNPCNDVQRLIEKNTKRNAFTLEEAKLIFSYPWENRLAYAACILLATTGMRMGEIRALTVEQVHEDYIDVCQAWGEYDGVKTPKNGKEREVPIDPEIYNLLMEVAPQKTGFIFTHNLNKPFDFQYVTLRLKKVMEAVGIDWRKRALSFHSFRHFFNTRLVAAGVSGEIVRAVVGHESEEMTDHYLHLQSKDMDFVRQVSSEISSLAGNRKAI